MTGGRSVLALILRVKSPVAEEKSHGSWKLLVRGTKANRYAIQDGLPQLDKPAIRRLRQR
jgi:hypothetical protein